MNRENKYEDIDMVDIEDYDDVYDLIGDSLFQLEKDTDYIAVYGKRDLIAYLFTEMLKNEYNFGYADFDVLDETLSERIYLMIIRYDFTISVELAISKNDKVIEHDAKVAFVDMDECKQRVIDYCVNSDKKVVLFGKSDDEVSDTKDIWASEDDDVYTVNGKKVSKKVFDKEFADLMKRFCISF